MNSPTWGRFLEPDPIGYASGANLYAYTNNDPLNLTDPYGLLTLQVGGTFSFSLGVFSFSVSGGLVVDLYGNSGFYGASGGGLGAGEFVKLGGSAAVSSASTIYDLASSVSRTGFTRVTSGTIGIGGIGGSVDIGQGYAQSGARYTSYGATLGSVTGAGVSQQYQYTQIVPLVQWTTPFGQPMTTPGGPPAPAPPSPPLPESSPTQQSYSQQPVERDTK